MNRFNPNSPIGAREWWDYQLAHSWEVNGGPNQTRHFMARLIANLAPPEVAYLRATPATILDWGCAMGEGVVLLAQAFPQATVAGLDVAQSAIELACQRYPAHEFILTEAGEIPRPFDVVVTSNCLEHFSDPLAYVRAHLAACRQFYVALVPYREFPRIDTHLVSFTEASFPAYLAGWVRLYTRVIEVDTRYWAGRQLLVVYGSAHYAQQRSADDPSETQAWHAYLTASPDIQALIEALALGQAISETRLAEAEADLNSLMGLKLGHLLPPGANVEPPQPSDGAQVKNLLVQVARQEHELATLRAQTHAITSSRAWAFVQLLWRLSARLAPSGSVAARLLRRSGNKSHEIDFP